MTISEVKTVISEQPESLPTYIRIQDGSDTEVHSIIVSADHQMSDNCLSYGAYYGYVGGGVFDGGYFKHQTAKTITGSIGFPCLRISKCNLTLSVPVDPIAAIT